MRCPACEVENAGDARQCSACGEKLKRAPRRRESAEESDTPFTWRGGIGDGILAYRCAALGMIPFLGLLLGPAALVLGFIAWRRIQASPDSRYNGRAVAAMILGGLVMITHWLGLYFMVLGLASSSIR